VNLRPNPELAGRYSSGAQSYVYSHCRLDLYEHTELSRGGDRCANAGDHPHDSFL
jgi:hypothetical protein